VSVEIRPCVREEISGALAPISHFFGRSPVDERTERFLRVFQPERMHAAFEGKTIVGGAGASSFELTVPGARLSAAGVTVVGVLPTHRRRGILTELTRVQLDDVRARGEPLACLWASEETIYGRFGYGMASLAGSWSSRAGTQPSARPSRRAGRGSLERGRPSSSCRRSTIASPR
jgi:predicted acetyltransferase